VYASVRRIRVSAVGHPGAAFSIFGRSLPVVSRWRLPSSESTSSANYAYEASNFWNCSCEIFRYFCTSSWPRSKSPLLLKHDLAKALQLLSPSTSFRRLATSPETSSDDLRSSFHAPAASFSESRNGPVSWICSINVFHQFILLLVSGLELYRTFYGVRQMACPAARQAACGTRPAAPGQRLAGKTTPQREKGPRPSQ